MSGRVLLKGAWGFVGSAFWRNLVAAGGPPEVLTPDNAESLDPEGVDLLIDCAGNSKKFLAERDPDYDRKKNVDEVVDTLDRFRPRHCILVSSSAVYSDPTSPDATREVDEPAGPVGVYGLHKRQAEQAVRRRIAKPLILRPAGLFGPGLAKGPLLDLMENDRPWISPDSQLQLLDVDLMAAVALQLSAVGGTYNVVPPNVTVLSSELPQWVAAQRGQWPGCLDLPRWQFHLDGRRFGQQALRSGVSSRGVGEFADAYCRTEARAAVPVLALAGGRGTRLGGPLPKPAMPLSGHPLVYHVLRPFLTAGYTQIGMLMGFGADEVAQAIDAEPALASARRFVESAPLGTGGAVFSALAEMDCESAMIVNGDTLLTQFDPEALVKHHFRTGADATLLAAHVPDAAAFGTLDVDADGRLLAFREKTPGRSAAVYAGVAVVRREALLGPCRSAGPCSLERDVFATLVRSRRVHVVAAPQLGFVDAGTPEGWAAAAQLVEGRTTCSS